MTLKVNGIELDVPDGSSIEVLDEGRRVVVKPAEADKPKEVHHFHHPITPVYPWWPYYTQPIITQPQPQLPVYPWTITCGDPIGTTACGSAGTATFANIDTSQPMTSTYDGSNMENV